MALWLPRLFRRRTTPRLRTRYAPARNGRPDPGEVLLVHADVALTKVVAA